MEIAGVIVSTSRAVKMKESYHSVENPEYLILTIDLLLTVLSNFETEVALKDSAFLWEACITRKAL